jgi:hypothetical protein
MDRFSISFTRVDLEKMNLEKLIKICEVCDLRKPIVIGGLTAHKDRARYVAAILDQSIVDSYGCMVGDKNYQAL